MTDKAKEIARSFARKIEDEARPPGDIRGAVFDDGRGDSAQIAISLKGHKSGKHWQLDTSLQSLTASIKRAAKYFSDGQVRVQRIEHPDINRKYDRHTQRTEAWGHRSGITMVHVWVLPG